MLCHPGLSTLERNLLPPIFISFREGHWLARLDTRMSCAYSSGQAERVFDWQHHQNYMVEVEEERSSKGKMGLFLKSMSKGET